jgi:hypothetical protein
MKRRSDGFFDQTGLDRRQDPAVPHAIHQSQLLASIDAMNDQRASQGFDRLPSNLDVATISRSTQSSRLAFRCATSAAFIARFRLRRCSP